MQPPPPPAPPPPAPQPGRAGSEQPRIVVGLLLAAPAAIALIVGYLGPTIRTFVWSLQERGPLGTGTGWVGLDNYHRIGGNLAGPFGFAALLATIPLLLLLVVAPMLAAAGHYAGRPARLTLRLALAVPMVCFVPVGLAMAWRTDRFDLESPRLSLWSAVGVGMSGVVIAVGVTVFLAVLRGQRPGRSVWPAGLTVAAVAAITTLAVGLQSFTHPFVMTQGGPQRQTATPMVDAFGEGLVALDGGAGAAHATLLLILLMVLGIGAALLVILTGLRIELEPAPARPPRPTAAPPGATSGGAGRIVALVGLVLGLAATLAITLYGLWPWLSRTRQLSVLSGPSEWEVLTYTWLPPVVSTVIGVGLAALAGFGIGALRPLGRWSELMLLPFAPWLFVGIGPLLLVKYDSAAAGDRIGNLLGMIPPIWLVVPALFVFTVLFRGLESRRRQRPAAGGRADLATVLLPSLPMLALVAAATWLVQSQSLLWGLLVTRTSGGAPTLIARQLSRFATDPDLIALGLLLPLPLLLILAGGLGALQWRYLDRLSIRVGPDRPPAPAGADQTGSISNEQSAAES